MDLDDVLNEEFEEERNESKELETVINEGLNRLKNKEISKNSFINERDFEKLKEAKDLTSVMNVYNRYAHSVVGETQKPPFMKDGSPNPEVFKPMLLHKEKKYAKEVASKLASLVDPIPPKELQLHINELTENGRIAALSITCSLVKALHETNKCDYRNEAAKQSADKLWPVIEEYTQSTVMDIEVGQRLLKEHRTLQQSLARELFPKLEELAPRVIGPAIQRNGVSAKDDAFPYI